MFGVKWFKGKVCPIGIDFGAESLKVVQLAREDGKLRVLAAGRRDVPDEIGSDPGARTRFLADELRQLLSRNPFKGRRAITSVPAEHLFVQHVRVPRMGEQELAKALPWEAQGKLPFPARGAVLRHLVAGELFVDNEAKTEVILMAAPRVAVENHLSAIVRAKLNVEAVLVPPLAILEAFRFLFTRAEEHEMCTLFVDIGASRTCAMITQSTRVVFVKQIPLAGQAIAAAVATRLGCSRAEARQQRLEMVKAQLERATEPGHQELPQPAALAARTAANAGRLTRAEPTASGNVQATATVAPPRQAKSAEDLAAIEAAAREQADQLARELTYCIRYYRSLHSDRPIDRVVFIGGEAHHRSICQQIARGLQLPAQLGDPMLRLHRTHWGVDCGDLTVGVPAPEWAIAFGCSLAGHESGG